MRKNLILFLSVALLACNAMAMGGKPAKHPAPKPVVTKPVEQPVQLPPLEVKAGEYGVKFEPVEYYTTPEERILIKEGEKKLVETIQTQCFKDFMLKSRLEWTKGRTNQQVYDHIMGLKGVVPVKVYYKKWGSCLGCTSAVAYRQPPQKTINLNRSFFTKSVSKCRWGATMAHESLGHSMGEYGHSSDWSVIREYTVPYKLGGAKEKYGSNAFTQCCKE